MIRIRPFRAPFNDRLRKSPKRLQRSPMRDAVVRARVQPDLKADAEKVFETLGINTTEAIRMFLSQVRLRGGLPFAVEVPKNEDLLVSARMRQEALDSLYDD
jgi:DNA-damage-inducible protein J